MTMSSETPSHAPHDGEVVKMPIEGDPPITKGKRRTKRTRANHHFMAVALTLIGGAAALAAAIEQEREQGGDLELISPEDIAGWKDVPVEYVPLLERLSGVSRMRLRGEIDWPLTVLNEMRQIAFDRLPKSETRGRPKGVNTALSEMLAASGCDIHPSTIGQWKRVPQAHIDDFERIMGIPRHVLRPDVYKPPNEPDSARYVTDPPQIEILPNIHVKKDPVVPPSNGASGDERANAPASLQEQSGEIDGSAIPQDSNMLPDGSGNDIVELLLAAGEIVEVGVLNAWNFPAAVMPPRLKDPNGKNLVAQVMDAEMSPFLEIDDFIVVDTSDTYPSPSGVFVLYNGVKAEIRRLLLTGGDARDPRVSIILDNPLYAKQGKECLLSELTIVGRAVRAIRSL